MCAQRAVDDAKEIRLRALRHHAIANQHRLECAALFRGLRRENVGEEIQRLQIAPAPPQIGVSDD